MSNDEVFDCLDLMFESVRLVETRFADVESANEFVQSVRKIQKLDASFLESHTLVDWDKIARFRDLVSHHYEQIDHEIVFDICKVHIPKLKEALQGIRSGLSVD